MARSITSVRYRPMSFACAACGVEGVRFRRDRVLCDPCEKVRRDFKHRGGDAGLALARAARRVAVLTWMVSPSVASPLGRGGGSEEITNE